MITSAAWNGKRYAVLGLARSGRATAEALLASGAEVLVWDDRSAARQPFEGRTPVADPLDADLRGYAGVVVSPGVPLNSHPIVGHAARFAVPVIGDIELFAQARPSLPPHKVVGITGTNGKSTTTALTHHILRTAGVAARMGGNIGLPILEQEPLAPNDQSVGIYVLELSSYQIDLTKSLDCDVAVLLNITPDHLDRYKNFGDYAASKAHLFAMQSSDHLAYDATSASLSGIHVPKLPASLQGPHNYSNAQAAIWITASLGVDPEAIALGLRTYPGLPHRMEYVAEIGGVTWVNDSKGTNTAATAPALAAFENIHWIVGGLAKEPGLGECEAELGHVKVAYTIGSSADEFAHFLDGKTAIKRSITLLKAIKDAFKDAKPGDTVLLSPACASFDQFRSFEHRGEVFRAAVKQLQEAAE